MKRSETPRDEYEKLSRDIRYNLYKTSMAEVANDVPAVLVCCMFTVMLAVLRCMFS